MFISSLKYVLNAFFFTTTWMHKHLFIKILQALLLDPTFLTPPAPGCVHCGERCRAVPLHGLCGYERRRCGGRAAGPERRPSTGRPSPRLRIAFCKAAVANLVPYLL